MDPRPVSRSIAMNRQQRGHGPGAHAPFNPSREALLVLVESRPTEVPASDFAVVRLRAWKRNSLCRFQFRLFAGRCESRFTLLCLVVSFLSVRPALTLNKSASGPRLHLRLRRRITRMPPGPRNGSRFGKRNRLGKRNHRRLLDRLQQLPCCPIHIN